MARDAIVEAVFEDDESYGHPKPMDPNDVKARIVGEVDEHGHTVLPAEESARLLDDGADAE